MPRLAAARLRQKQKTFMLLLSLIALAIFGLLPDSYEQPVPDGTFDVMTSPLPDSPQRLFRFELPEIQEMHHELELPQRIVTPERDSIDGVTALSLVMYRLAFPRTYRDTVPLFRRSAPALARIFTHTCELIHGYWGHLLEFDLQRIRPVLADFAEAIHEMCPVPNCFGFIDATFRPRARPCPHPDTAAGMSANAVQRAYYSGYRHLHGEKFQSITYPNGLIGALHGPFAGRASDARILGDSMIGSHTPFMDAAGNSYMLYGDLAYALTTWLWRPFTQLDLQDPVWGGLRLAFNVEMSRVRIAVEWGFFVVANAWQTIDFRRYQRVYQTRPGLLYRIATLLTNCRTCMHGSNRIAQYFDVPPPTLHDYLAELWHRYQ